MENNRPISRNTIELKKFIGKYQSSSGSGTFTFKVQCTDIEGVEALWARLQEGTIDKRGADDMGVDVLQILNLLEAKEKPQKTPSRVRYPTEDPDDQTCARKRRQLRPSPNAQLKKEHDATDMSGKSPGKRKRHQHSSDQFTGEDDRADETRSSETLPRNIIDSVDEYVGLIRA